MADKNDDRNLYYLNELSDYKVADDDPDVRGWKVKDRDDRVIGKVDNLLVNKNKKKVVYLDVEVDESIISHEHDKQATPAQEGVHEFTNEDGEDHLIIPVGMVGVNRDDRSVFTDQIDRNTFAATNRFRKGTPINREYENYVIRHYSGDTEYENYSDEALYERKEFDDSRWRR